MTFAQRSFGARGGADLSLAAAAAATGTTTTTTAATKAAAKVCTVGDASASACSSQGTHTHTLTHIYTHIPKAGVVDFCRQARAASQASRKMLVYAGAVIRQCEANQ